MLKIASEPVFTHDVEVHVPKDGGHLKATVKVTYRVIPRDEADRFNLLKGEDLAAFLQRIVTRIEGFAGDDGKPVPYSDELRDAQFRVQPWLAQAVAAHYFRSIGGTKEGN